MSSAAADLQSLVDRYCALDRVGDDGFTYTTRTQLVRIEQGVADRAAELLAPLASGPGPWAVAFDVRTFGIAGEAVLAALARAGIEADELLIADRDEHEGPRCDDATIDAFEQRLRTRPYAFAVAVGAGTINDIVKMASHRAGVDYAAVATAPSMNGYTSAIAAILSVGVKTTQSCSAPVAVLADPAILAASPYRMIASGIGDLYSKPVSNADWRLSHRLLGTRHSSIVMEIVEAGSAVLEGVAPRLPARDVDAVARLTAALMLSGLAMQAAGSSMSASGGEHLISHYIDMTAFAFGQSHDFHGCQVAVGTLATSELYELVRGLDPATIDVEACVARLPAWPEWRATLASRFGPLTDAVLPHAEKIHPTPDELRGRLTRLRDEWESIMDDVGTTLRPSAELRAELVSADCPVTFPEIGVDRDRAWRAVRDSKDIRARYTILHLAAELGVLDAFTDALIERQFGPVQTH
jgi:glycerol-1-phosphate dehydrogenase [NAD(P)+]